MKGNQVSITCSASGTPTPTFSWSKGGTTVFNGATLSLSNVDKTDSGVYTCTGTNTEGTNSEQFTVNVQYAPEMTTTTNSISATDGETISMTCNNDANPIATTFEWNCQGSITNTTKTLSVSVSGTDDFSCSCKAFNSIGGSVSQTFSVTVSATGGTGNIGAATGGGLTTGEIAAICLAVLFIVLLIIIIIVCCCLYGVCAGVCGKKEKHKVEPKKEKEEEVIHKVEIPRFHEKPKQRVPSAVTRKDVDLTVNQDNMMYEEEEFEINTKYAIVPPGSHRSVNGTIISMQDQRAPKDHRLPALDLTYDEEERRRKRRRRKKKKHRSHREPAEGMETPHELRESSRSRRSHRSHRSSHRYSGELMDDENYHSRYEDGDLVVIPGPDSYDH
ncbi:hypothetical protein KUTeg_006316 [Tegillarca granosa]|uniref:Ig-like domain-containing protein n=1 Tax=Tegillarca granosa TaxID=220873 RepID=A0ABQ9FK33_TEGGR|nr:hypothetical protein KUTeg_006316 [Tegillarca granosa]